MQSLDTALFALVRERIITAETCVKYANSPENMKKLCADLPED
jgi:Tfp pilus assembly ATPase PilU